MTLEKDSSSTIIGPIVALVVIFRFAGEDCDVKDLLRVAAPGFLVAHLAVGGTDDFGG